MLYCTGHGLEHTLSRETGEMIYGQTNINRDNRMDSQAYTKVQDNKRSHFLKSKQLKGH